MQCGPASSADANTDTSTNTDTDTNRETNTETTIVTNTEIQIQIQVKPNPLKSKSEAISFSIMEEYSEHRLPCTVHVTSEDTNMNTDETQIQISLQRTSEDCKASRQSRAFVQNSGVTYALCYIMLQQWCNI